jgi:hypothetical protein
MSKPFLLKTLLQPDFIHTKTEAHFIKSKCYITHVLVSFESNTNQDEYNFPLISNATKSYKKHMKSTK